MKWCYLGLLAPLLLNASTVYASVKISEVAWMGGSVSANHEWIELYNDGTEAVSVAGWVLSDGMNFNITLDGTIGSQSYAVLERSSEDSSPVAAFLIYTGALVNTGATLVLKNAEGGTVDQVAGGENWQNIGGNNSTKETAQLTSSGWRTHAATPGTVNYAGSETPSAVSTGSSNSSSGISNKSSGGGGGKALNSATVNLDKFGSGLDIKIKAQKVAYVNQLVSFEAGIDFENNQERLISYQWNFGDTYVAQGKKVEHQYKYPGSYVVVVEATYKDNSEVTRHEVNVMPVDLDIKVNQDGDIEVVNNALYDVDVSGYTVKGVESVVFPSHTILLPGSVVTIVASRLKVSPGNLIVLYDANKVLVSSTYEEPRFDISSVATPQVYERVLRQNQIQVKPNTEEENQATTTTAYTGTVFPAPVVFDTDRDQPSFTDSPEATKWPYLVFIGMLLLILTGIFLTHTNKKIKLITTGD